jgi:hypothetical protein
MILSNELPDFKDETGVIATRFVILQTVNSYLGREDTDLETKLCAELSGILNWALEGWHRLQSRGRFLPPGDGEINEELSSNASAVKAFVADRCELGDEFTVTIETAYNAYRGWCEGNGARGWAADKSIQWQDEIRILRSDQRNPSARWRDAQASICWYPVAEGRAVRVRFHRPTGGPHVRGKTALVRMVAAWSSCTSYVLLYYIYN